MASARFVPPIIRDVELVLTQEEAGDLRLVLRRWISPTIRAIRMALEDLLNQPKQETTTR